MTAASAGFLAVVSIAFPREGQRLPYVERCYAIGAADAGERSVSVAGTNATVAATGAWGVTFPVKPGRNTISANGVRRTFHVASPPPPAATNAPPKIYGKLEYAGDTAKPRRALRSAAGATIVLDPGHGGGDSGAISPHGRHEKEANLLLARAVRRELEKRGVRVVMTRGGDTAVELYDRPKAAHREDADAFVSIHHNAPPHDADPIATRYHCVYAWNAIGESLARAIYARMDAAAQPGLPGKGVLHANFAVTRNPEIPSCLVEADFITSPQGEADVWNPARRAATAKAIADGIADWCAAGQSTNSTLTQESR